MEQEREYVSNAELFDQLLTAFSLDLSSQLIPSSVSKDYSGVHLGHIYEDNDLKHLLKSFKNNQPLDAFYALKIINDATEKLKTMPNIRECLIDDPLESGCIIVGDLHGNFNDLYHIIQKYGLPGSQYKFIFNGDFVDRGSKQMEVLLTLLYSFLIRPNKVFLNRGNHEDMSMNVRSSFNPNFFNHSRNMYGKYSSVIFRSCIDLYSYLPLATILNNLITHTKFFIVHGGISDMVDLEYVQHKLVRHKFKRISQFQAHGEDEVSETRQISDLLWSDPIRVENGNLRPIGATSEIGCYFNSNRNLGSLFGHDLTTEFCERHGFTALIRSHQVRDRGYSEDHAKCLTIFSASHYCGGLNYGAIFKVTPLSFKPKPHRYKTKSGDISEDLAVKNQELIKLFKRLIQSNEDKLMPEFERFDENKNGQIETEKWAEVLSKFLKNEISAKHLISLKDFLCECERVLDVVNYRTLFKKKIGDSSRTRFYDKNMLHVIENLFEILDRDNNKRISVDDAKEVLKVLNERLGLKYSVDEDAYDFIKQLDKNGDNQIDLEEFKRTFLEEEEVGQT